MRRSYTITIFVLLLSFVVELTGCSKVPATNKKEDPVITEISIYGNVKSYTVKINSANKMKFGKMAKDKIYTISYNKIGKITENTTYENDGSIIEKCTYKYDDRGNQLEEALYGSNGVFGSKYKYNDRRNRIERALYDSEGVLVYNSTYKYDDKGNMIEDAEYFSDESLRKKYIITYSEFDKHGNWLKAISTDDLKNQISSIVEREIEYYD